MANKRALLMVRSDTRPEIETGWNNWYHTEHIPGRLNIPGFLSARRFIAVRGEPKYMSIYDITSVDVLTSEAYLKLRDKEAYPPSDSFEAINRALPHFARGVYEQIYPEQGEYQIPNTKFIHAVGHDVPPDKEEEYNAWYNTEHVPGILRVPGFVAARRFKFVGSQMPPAAGSFSSSPKYLTLYDLESTDAYQTDAFAAIDGSPWTAWVRNWYNRSFRFIGRLIYPEP